MRFRQFITENPVVLESGPGYITGAAYSGPLQLPDLGMGAVYDKPGQMPPGGFSNIGQVTQSYIDKARYGNVEEYQKLQTLQKLGIMANNIVTIVNLNDPAQLRMTKRYKLAKYDPTSGFISGLPLQGMISDGGYPELRQQDIDMGYEKLKVIVDDPTPPTPAEIAAAGLPPGGNIYALDTHTLRDMMIQMKEEMTDKERQYKAWNYLGGEADRAFGLMAGQGQMAYSKGVNPLSGS